MNGTLLAPSEIVPAHNSSDKTCGPITISFLPNAFRTLVGCGAPPTGCCLAKQSTSRRCTSAKHPMPAALGHRRLVQCGTTQCTPQCTSGGASATHKPLQQVASATACISMPQLCCEKAGLVVASQRRHYEMCQVASATARISMPQLSCEKAGLVCSKPA